MAQRDHRGMTTVRPPPVFCIERLNLTVPLAIYFLDATMATAFVVPLVCDTEARDRGWDLSGPQ